MTSNEKINRCTETGECGAQNLEEQKGCTFFTALKTLYRGHCAVLMNNCHCLHLKALTAKLKELRTATAIGDDWRSKP